MSYSPRNMSKMECVPTCVVQGQGERRYSMMRLHMNRVGACNNGAISLLHIAHILVQPLYLLRQSSSNLESIEPPGETYTLLNTRYRLVPIVAMNDLCTARPREGTILRTLPPGDVLELPRARVRSIQRMIVTANRCSTFRTASRLHGSAALCNGEDQQTRDKDT